MNDGAIRTYAATVALSVVVCEAVYRVAHVAACRTSLDGGDRRTLALKFVNVLHALCVGPAAAYALLGGVVAGGAGYDAALTDAVRSALRRDAAAAPALFSGAPSVGAAAALALTPVTVGFFCWDLARVGSWARTTASERALMVAHHALSILIWPVAAIQNVAGPFLLHFLYTECSSPLLQGRWVAQAFYGRRSRADLGASAAFAAAFLVVRSTNVHVVLAALLDARPWDAALHPTVPRAVRVAAALTLGVPSLLNVAWTLQILKMGRKALAPPKAKAP